MLNPNPLAGFGILSPLQKQSLQVLSALPEQEFFYLGGGTALSEYYLGHRYSFDLDFFTSIEEIILPLSYKIESLISQNNLPIQTIRRFHSFVEFVVADELRIDFGLGSPVRFEPPQHTTDGIHVSGFLDLCVDKLLAYFGRIEPRDAVDVYFILQHQSFDEIIEKASEKDSGFDLYWMAVALYQAERFPDDLSEWPVKMIKDFAAQILKKQFRALSFELLDRTRSSHSS